MSFQKRKEYNRFNNNRYEPYNNKYTRIDDDNNKKAYNMQQYPPSLMEQVPTVTYNTNNFYGPVHQERFTNERISNRHVYNEPIQIDMMSQQRNKQFTTPDNYHHFPGSPAHQNHFTDEIILNKRVYNEPIQIDMMSQQRNSHFTTPDNYHHFQESPAYQEQFNNEMILNRHVYNEPIQIDMMSQHKNNQFTTPDSYHHFQESPAYQEQFNNEMILNRHVYNEPIQTNMMSQQRNNQFATPDSYHHFQESPAPQEQLNNEMISNRHVYNEPIQTNMMSQQRNNQFPTPENYHHFQEELISTSKRSWEQFNGSNERTKKLRHNDTEQQHQYQQNWRSSEMNASSQNANIEPIDSNDQADTMTTTETNTNKQYTIPTSLLNRAVNDSLPYFIIEFDKTVAAHDLPSKQTALNLIQDHFHKKNIKIQGFSDASFKGHRLRVGVDNLEDYSKLIKTDKWPTTINKIKIQLITPTFVPGAFAVVVKHIPQDISIKTVADEINHLINSADNFRRITDLYNSGIKHIRFTVSDLEEYKYLLQLGRLSIGTEFCKVTKYIPPAKLTCCTNCWKVGHLRDTCNLNFRKCRICLEPFDRDHRNKCSGKPLCAQCGLGHHSRDANCEYIQKYRETLKKEIQQALQDGIINLHNNRYQPYNNKYTGTDDDNNKKAYNMQQYSPFLMEKKPPITYNTDDFYCPTDQEHCTNEMVSNKHVYNEPIQINMMSQQRNIQFTTPDNNHHFQESPAHEKHFTNEIILNKRIYNEPIQIDMMTQQRNSHFTTPDNYHHFQEESISTSKRNWEQFNGSGERTKKSRHNDTEQQHQYQQNWRSSEMNASSQNANIESIDSNDQADTITTTETNNNKQYTIPINILQRAISESLPYFIIDFDKTVAADDLPHKRVACNAIEDHFQKNKMKIKGFPFITLSGHRLGLGVDNLEDYSKLINTDKWPTTVRSIKIQLIKPKFVPEAFAVVVRHIPQELSIETVADEIKHSINSADNFKQITYSKTCPTKHIRFTVSDLDEFRSVLQSGHLPIANRFYRLTKYIPAEILTYCTKCMKVGHFRYTCNFSFPKCRICLEPFDRDHRNKCSGKPLCAQCGLGHHSRDGDCEYIQKYRETLKTEIQQALEDGIITPQCLY